MTEWTWKTVDWNKAQKGDIILDGTNVSYIEDIHTRKTNLENLVSPETRIELIEYYHNLEWCDRPGSGYSFTCYKDGTIPGGDKYFEEVKTLKGLIYKGIRERGRGFTEAAVIRCTGSVPLRRGNKITGYETCNEEISLDMVMTNTCEECGADYNSSGQKLAPREQWGWDTGESLGDILSSDFSIHEPVPGRQFEGDY